MAKFKPGDMVMAKNGRGEVYQVGSIEAPTRYNGERYYLDNGSVDIRKRARSGYHDVERIDRGYKKVN